MCIYNIIVGVLYLFTFYPLFYSQIGCELGSLNQEEFSSSDEEFVGKAPLKGIINNTAVNVQTVFPKMGIRID